jgi:hypothetical protein
MTTHVRCGTLFEGDKALTRANATLGLGDDGRIAFVCDTPDALAVCVAQFGAVDVDIANIVRFEPLALFRDFARREARDAMALKAAMQGASAQVWNGVLQATEDIIQWQESSAPEFDDGGFLGRGQDRALWLRPMGASTVSVRLRHFRTVLTLRPYWVARRRAGACAALSSARIRGVVRALP